MALILLNLSSSAASQADNHSCHRPVNFFHFYHNCSVGWWPAPSTVFWVKAHYWFIEWLYIFSNLFHTHFLASDARRVNGKKMHFKYTEMENLQYNLFFPPGKIARLTSPLLQKVHIHLSFSELNFWLSGWLSRMLVFILLLHIFKVLVSYL